LIEGATIVEPPRNPVAIELVDVTKRFGPVVANQDITFDARYGEVHALIGENGAGKSTLMSIVAGLYRPDSGRLRINGQQVHFKSPRDAIERGIGMVYQHFMLVETMTVAENLLIGMPQQGIGLKTDAAAAAVRDLSSRFGLDVDPDAYIWQLSVGEQQRVEIIRLLFRGAKILVLDEPTAVLTPAEAAGLIKTVRTMAAEGYCIIFISHKLDEVLRVADRITVLRRGQTVGTVTPGAVDRRSLARMMVGRPTFGVGRGLADLRPALADRVVERVPPAADDRRSPARLRRGAEHVHVVLAAELLVCPDDDEGPCRILVTEEPPAPLAGGVDPGTLARRSGSAFDERGGAASPGELPSVGAEESS